MNWTAKKTYVNEKSDKEPHEDNGCEYIFAEDLRKNIIQSNLTNATSVIMPSLEQMLLRVI